jgi:hypothetical protein
MRKAIFLDEMRARVGERLFGDDLIVDLSSADWAVLKKHVPYQVERLNHRLLGHIDKSPRPRRAALDRALGRYYTFSLCILAENVSTVLGLDASATCCCCAAPEAA